MRGANTEGPLHGGWEALLLRHRAIRPCGRASQTLPAPVPTPKGWPCTGTPLNADRVRPHWQLLRLYPARCCYRGRAPFHHLQRDYPGERERAGRLTEGASPDAGGLHLCPASQMIRRQSWLKAQPATAQSTTSPAAYCLAGDAALDGWSGAARSESKGGAATAVAGHSHGLPAGRPRRQKTYTGALPRGTGPAGSAK